jgi:ATP-dependent exoDNAse (exonuclease V) alpha subunit
MRELKAEQAVAFEQIREFLSSDRKMHMLSGAAGTGKTYTLGEVVSYAMVQHISVIVTAPTHKAVRVLKKLVDQPTITFSTIHSALGMKETIGHDGTISFKADPKAGYPAKKYKLVIIDESSMLDDAIFNELVVFSDRAKQILFVGDPYQIPPVNHIHAKCFLKSIQAQYQIGLSTLNEIVRQAEGSPIITYATSIRKDIHAPVQIFNPRTVKVANSGVFWIPRKQKATFLNDVLPLFQTVDYKNDIDYVKVIAWKNITVDTYNRLIRIHVLGENLPKIIAGDRLVLDAPIVEERKVIISANEECEVISTVIQIEDLSEIYKLKYYYARVRVFNNDVFNEYMIKIIHEDSEKDFEKILELQKAVAKSYQPGSYQAKSSWMDYYEFYNMWAKVKYSYCISAHRSQGSTYHTAYVLAWDILISSNVLERNRILYTASTRPSTNLYIEY